MSDIQWMQEALTEAKTAFNQDEVPVGTVVVLDNKIIGRGHNQTETLADPTAHAEIIALSAAANYLKNWRLTDAVVYSTVEPCLMCCGALILARIKKLVFAVHDKKFGACGSLYNIPADNKFNHKFDVVSGILAEPSQHLMQEFFKRKRTNPSCQKKTNINSAIAEDSNIIR